MKRIGLFTLFNGNYGSILQCYSTKKYIERYGLKVDTLYENKHSTPLSAKRKIIDIVLHPTYYYHRLLERTKGLSLSKQSLTLMNDFVKSEISPLDISNFESNELNNLYDAFVVGSDQVWNVYNPIPDAYFLKFANNNKKIAFAVSLGASEYDVKALNKLRKGTNGFKRISVREKSGKEILEKCTSASISRISDPTILFDANEWRNFYGQKGIENPNRIILHFLNKPSEVALMFIQNLKNSHPNFEVIAIGYFYEELKNIDCKFVDCGPREYLYYIDNTNYICTDSFHTTLFSIYFQKEFFVFDRQYNHSHPQTSRIIDLLNLYHLDDRLIKDINTMTNSNVQDMWHILKVEREKTRLYLMEEISKI